MDVMMLLLMVLSSSILVDDTEDVIEDFNNALGHGILHRDADETISKIKSIMNLD